MIKKIITPKNKETVEKKEVKRPITPLIKKEKDILDMGIGSTAA